MARVVLSLFILAVISLVAVIVEPLLGLGDLDSRVVKTSASPTAATTVSEFLRVEAGRSDGPNVLLITIDTLRADHLGVYGYHRATSPRIDEFARQCRVFERAYATSPFTAPSVMSMLMGLYPYHHGIRLLWQRIEEGNITIADHLRRSGYQTAAVVSNLVLSDKSCGLGGRFEHYDDAVDEPEAHRNHMLERRASRTTDAAIDWLRNVRTSTRPLFLWVHYIDPHGPYRPPEDAPVHFTHDAPQTVDPSRIAEYVREPDVTDAMDYVDRYDGEIAYTDREVERLLDAYNALGLTDDSLIMLTSDHGEQMADGESSFFCHGYDVRESVIRVPLMIRCKSLPVGREGRPVSIADVMPTVLEVVGLPVPADLDGRSLAGRVSQRPPYAAGPDSGGSGGLRRTFIYPRRKVVVQHGGSDIIRQAWAFDLDRDAAELHPLPVDKAEPAYIVLADIIRSDPDPGGKPTRYAEGFKPQPFIPDGLDAEAMRQLKSLGYVN